MSKILIFGGTGGIGQAIKPLLSERHEIITVGSTDYQLRLCWPVAAAISDHKPDVIINLAVRNIDGFLHKQDRSDVEEQIEINVEAATYIMMYGLQHFRERGKGSIIFASSILADRPMMGTGVYGASKAYVNHLVRTAVLENASKGVQVNSIEMGYFDAGLAHKMPKDVLDKVIESIPMKRLGSAQELVNTINFILDTPYVNGSNLVIAGGL